MNARLWPPVVVALLALLSAVLVGTGEGGLIRQLVVSLFLLVGPGLALVQWWRAPAGWLELVVSVALSVALAALLSVVMVVSLTWSPLGAVYLLAAFSLILALARLAAVRWPSA